MLQSQGHDKNFQFALARIGGRERENQWFELSNSTHAARGSDRLHELMVKIAFLTLLFDDRLYMMVSETEM